MQITCALSSIQFSVQHFPATVNTRVLAHPVFHLEQKTLLSYSGKWAAGELTHTDSYLLFLALLHSTDLVEFRLPAVRTELTDSIVASNMEALIISVSRLNTITLPGFSPPQFVISQDTKTLSNVQHWIGIWNEYLAEFNSNYRSLSSDQKLQRRQYALDRLMKTSTARSEKAFARILADWAESAGSFPRYVTLAGTSYLPLAEYWKQIIQKCFNSEEIFSIPKQDLQELIEHCEDNIVHGNSYAFQLMDTLRKGLQRQNNFLGFGELELSSTPYKILDADSSVEEANKLALIESAPSTLPVEREYPSKIAFLRAKLKYQLAQDYHATQAAQSQAELNTTKEV